MNWEQRLVLENVKNLLNQQELLPHHDGEIDFNFLSELERLESGKIGVIAQGLLRFFGEDCEKGNPAQRLEELAAVILLWAAQLRVQKQKFARAIGTSTKLGAKVQLRLPDHFPLFIGTICEDDHVYIPVLQKKYPIDEVQIVPMQAQQIREHTAPAVLQDELRKSILELQKQSKNNSKIFARGDKL